MNVSINGRLFEWDDAKNKINKIKHGINFKTAARFFSDPYYTNRDEKIRLISACEATERLRRLETIKKNL